MKRHQLIQTVERYAQLPLRQLAERLPAEAAARPRCPVTRYLLGCCCLDQGRAALGVRHLMVAYHAEPRLESAALLVFAGLSWVGQREAALLPVLLATWDEFRRPQFDRTWPERLLLDAFAAPEPGLGQAPLLARRLWRLPLTTLRDQIREAMPSPAAALYPLLAVPV
ncbi:MAG TPA: hypothetical protein P5255_09035 [Phycisphaerae bacterium]|jgi:hypothetical protein|nr:hypothetical protein [Phycisphaerae bacterium]